MLLQPYADKFSLICQGKPAGESEHFGSGMVAGMPEAVAGGSNRLDGDREPVGDGEPRPAIDLSVIIATYNARAVLADFLNSI